MTTGWAYVLAGVVLLAGSRVQAEQALKGEQPAPPALEALIENALDRSAELAALRARIAAAEARITTAGAAPDPMASAGFTNLPIGGGLRLDRDTMSGFEIMLSQELPRSFRRRLRAEIQRDEAAALRARHTSVANGIVRGVRQVYVDLQYLDEALVIAEQNKGLAQDILAVAESRYRTGKVSQQDVFQSQVQLSRMLDAVVALRRQRAAAAARLNRMLYRAPGEVVPRLPPLSPSVLSTERTSAQYLWENNSVLRESQTRVAQAEAALNLAQQWRKPDYGLSFRYMVREPVEMEPMNGTDMWGAALAINLPMLNRKVHEAEVRAAEAERTADQQQLQALLNAIPSQLAEVVIEVKRAEEQLSLVETGLLPQAEGAVAAARSAYVAGRTDALSLLANQLNLYNLQLERAQLLRQHEQSLAELEYQASGALQALPMAAVGVAPVAAMAPTAGPSAGMGAMSGGASAAGMGGAPASGMSGG